MCCSLACIASIVHVTNASGMDTLKVAKVPWELTNKSPLVYITVDHISARLNLWQGGGFEEVPVCTISQLSS